VLLHQDLRAWLQDVQVAVEHFYPTLAFYLANQANPRKESVLQACTLAYLGSQASTVTGTIIQACTVACHLASQAGQSQFYKSVP
jgi:hypothetical protein